MSDADSLDAVHKFAGANIVDFDCLIIFRDDEEAIVFQVGCQMVEMVLNTDHARRGQILGELIRRNVGFAAVNIRKLDGLDQFQWRRIRGKYNHSRRCPRSDRECGNREEIPLVRTHKSPPFKTPQISVWPEATPQMPCLLRSVLLNRRHAATLEWSM